MPLFKVIHRHTTERVHIISAPDAREAERRMQECSPRGLVQVVFHDEESTVKSVPHFRIGDKICLEGRAWQVVDIQGDGAWLVVYSGDATAKILAAHAKEFEG